METLEVTWSRALRVWWSIVWRTAVFGMLALVVVMVPLIIFLVDRYDAEKTAVIVDLVGYAVTVPVGVWVVKRVLTRQFRSYRIVLLPSDDVLLTRHLRQSARE